MNINKFFVVTFILSFVTAASASPPGEGDVFWWKMGIMLGIPSQLAACNELYPEFINQNESAYITSVFANPIYDALLKTYPQNVPQDVEVNKLLAVELKTRLSYKSAAPDVLRRLCSEFPKNVEKSTVNSFGMSSTAIKKYLIENRKSSRTNK